MNDQNINNINGNNPYQAPSAPQPSNATFDYNQLYGNNNTASNVEKKEEMVFDEPEITNTVVAPVNEPQIKIASDELIPEFDASVLETIPQQEKMAEEPKKANISRMAVGKKAEDEKNKSNLVFILLIFGIIAAAIWFLFPILLNI